MSTRISDLKIHDELVVIVVDGFKPEYDTAVDEHGHVWEVDDGIVDLPGDANWLREAYGMADEDQAAGILSTDYDFDGWKFSVLLDASETDAFCKVAEEAGYDVIEVEPITEPTLHGDGGGTVEILKHRNGWVVLEN